jgi:hypothetical protein
MLDRAHVLEQFERLTTQLTVARAFLLDTGNRERMVHARAILDAVGRSVNEIIDLEIDPALGWRPGHRVDALTGRPR